MRYRTFVKLAREFGAKNPDGVAVVEGVGISLTEGVMWSGFRFMVQGLKVGEVKAMHRGKECWTTGTMMETEMRRLVREAS